MKRHSYENLVAVILILLAVFSRVLPHPPNFSPVIAVALFAGAALTNRRLAIGVTLSALLLTDAVLGFYDGISFVYLAYLAVIAQGFIAKPQGLGRIAGHSVGASVVFFILSNLGVWLFSGLYEGTWSGLVSCFVLALPFFQTTLFSTLASSVILFALHARFKKVPAPIRVLK